MESIYKMSTDLNPTIRDDKNNRISIRLVKKYVDEHLKEIYSIACVATGMNVSPETLRKYFLRMEKLPLRDYILYRKIETMKVLLTTTDEKCYWICYAVGLREDYGAHIFKRYFKKTMNEFRRWHMDNITKDTISNIVA